MKTYIYDHLVKYNVAEHSTMTKKANNSRVWKNKKYKKSIDYASQVDGVNGLKALL